MAASSSGVRTADARAARVESSIRHGAARALFPARRLWGEGGAALDPVVGVERRAKNLRSPDYLP
ncbi:MAG: hypothetical protein NXI30_25940 [bacterium]|nr:hypothetical protein [bacterium]